MKLHRPLKNMYTAYIQRRKTKILRAILSAHQDSGIQGERTFDSANLSFPAQKHIQLRCV